MHNVLAFSATVMITNLDAHKNPMICTMVSTVLEQLVLQNCTTIDQIYTEKLVSFTPSQEAVCGYLVNSPSLISVFQGSTRDPTYFEDSIYLEVFISFSNLMFPWVYDQIHIEKLAFFTFARSLLAYNYIISHLQGETLDHEYKRRDTKDIIQMKKNFIVNRERIYSVLNSIWEILDLLKHTHDHTYAVVHFFEKQENPEKRDHYNTNGLISLAGNLPSALIVTFKCANLQFPTYKTI